MLEHFINQQNLIDIFVTARSPTLLRRLVDGPATFSPALFPTNRLVFILTFSAGDKSRSIFSNCLPILFMYTSWFNLPSDPISTFINSYHISLRLSHLQLLQSGSSTYPSLSATPFF
ncbi:unnamed protein product [Hymenolepis diminuta]|uniref:Uncharacterized protein n=1 Tax=Hymenolepis diminuta TaxID=6216 RepID=A0A564YR78_HYMDI|nr:unnamed protein product [Hymenolepis diminuta]